MSDLWEEYPDLMKAYKDMALQAHRKEAFEAQWHKISSVAADAKDNAVVAAVPAKEMETLLRSLAEPFSKTFGAQGTASHGPQNLPAAPARSTDGFFCRSCGFKSSPDAAFCRNCGAKLG